MSNSLKDQVALVTGGAKGFGSGIAEMLAAAGARPQRLLWASTGTKDPSVPESLYAEAFAAPDTIATLPVSGG